MRYLRWISLLTVLALLCAMVPISLAEDIDVDVEEEDIAEETVEEVDSLDLSDLMFEDEISTPENNDLDLLDADLYETEGEEQVAPAVAANASSDFEIDEDGVLVQYKGFDKKVTIPNGVKEIGYSAFEDDTTLESITIPSSVTYIGPWAFNGCTKLKSITIPNSVTEIGWGALHDCKSLTSIQLSNNMTELPGDFFSHCSSLKTLTIPKNIKTIGSYAFSTCEKLERVTIPNTVTEIGNGAFMYCYNLKRVALPNKIASIEESTFSNCDVLESVTIPASVKSIARTAFDGCDNVVIRGTAGSYAEKYAKGMGITFNAPIVSFEEERYCILEKDFDDAAIIYINQSRTFNTVQKPSDLATSLKWSSSNPKIVTVDQSGKVTGIKHGIATLTAAPTNGKGKAAKIKVYVPEPSTIYYMDPLKVITMGSIEKYSIDMNTPYFYETKAEFPISWSVSDQSIISITKTGDNSIYVKGIKPGKATITATASDGGKKTLTITVVRPDPESITIDQEDPIILHPGEKCTLSATVKPVEANQAVTWTSYDTDVATVNKNGVVTAKSAGFASIEVNADNYKYDSISIEVLPPLPTAVTLNKAKVAMALGEEVPLFASFKPLNAETELSVTSNKPGIVSATIDGTVGVILYATKKGKATITVETDNGKKAKCVVTVKAAPKKVTLYKGSKKLKNKQTLTLKKGKTLKLKARLPAKTAASLTWTSSKPTVATVDENGRITALKPGTTTITVKTHNKKTAKVKIKVK